MPKEAWGCPVDGNGVHLCSVGDLPPQLAALCQSNVGVQDRAVKAVLNRDETALRQTVKLDPLTASELTLAEIDEMIDELLVVNVSTCRSTSSVRQSFDRGSLRR